jgi:coenzyme F420 hydrogenase subunit beta
LFLLALRLASYVEQLIDLADVVNVVKVVEAGLCHGCGTCAGVCPTGALEMKVVNGLWVPQISWDKCTSCGFCGRVCPGYRVDFESLNMEAFGKLPSDWSTGECLNCHVGHSNDQNLRFNAASGGLASQILISALEQGLIDGALVTRMNPERPLESEAFVARSRKEILAASRSKYCPVAANIALKDVLRLEGRFAVVGLPCHIHGVRKAERLYPALRKKIVLHVGLMCSHMVSFSGTEFVVGKLNVDTGRVLDISYRGKGWPGSMTVKSKDGSVSVALVGSWHSYWPIFSSFLFTPLRCAMCPDQLAELADISLGDAWLPEFRGDRVGMSIMVTRTRFAEDLLRSMKLEGKISLSPVSLVKVKRSQAVNQRFKKDDFSTRLALLRMFGRQTPVFVSGGSGGFSFFGLLRALFIFMSIKLSLNKRVMSVLGHFPFGFFRLYSGIYRFMSDRL